MMKTLQRLAVLLGVLIDLLAFSSCLAEASSDGKLLFLGNKNIPPVVYLDNGVPSGVAVDIARALARHLPQPVEIRAMDWPEAQASVARGEADALIQINETEERRKTYDFSDTLLESQFSIFTGADRVGITGISSLRGLLVGVESGGLPRQLLEKNPRIRLRVIPNFLEGFRLVNDGAIDAVVVDYQVGAYVIAENKLRNIKVTGEPVAFSYSALAVRKGNSELLGAINSALRIIKADGTYQKIIDAWQPKEGVFHTREQIEHQIFYGAIGTLLVLFLIAVIWTVTLKRELTRRRASEEKRREEHSTLRSIIDSANALIFSVDRQYRYTSFNRGHAAAMNALYGAAIERGRSLLEYMSVPEDRETARRNLDRALAGEELVEESCSGEELRSRKYFQVSHSPIRSAGEIIGVAVLAQDMTGRKQAEAVRTQLAAIVQSSNDAIIGRDLDGFITSWNPGAEKVYGYRADEVIGRPVSILMPETRRDEIAKLIGRVRGGESIADFETERFRKDGARIDVSLALSPIRDAADRIIGVSAIARDITEKKRAEAALRKLNRALVTLSRCNEALVHAIEEPSLLDSMCRIIVEEGGYRLAWVGYAQDDAARSILPMARAGAGVEYLSQATFSWAADTPTGRGPGGIAIRLGVAQVVQDAMHDPAFAPWRDIAARMGFASLLVLPLLVGNGERRAEAVLAIYSAEPGAFDEQEVALLTELASDLSYGIAVLRAREERKRAGERLEHSLENTIRSIAMALEKRDPHTAGHQRRVAELAIAIGRELGLDVNALTGLRLAATIHDIGKIYVPSEILNRPGKLTPIEFEFIKTHTQVGYEIVKGIDFPWPVADMILQHHERLDGSGYPNGLKADAICFEARIVAVADVVEAMSSHRPYRPAHGVDAALAEVEAKRGVLFDERIVNACTALIREGRFAWSQE